MASLINIVIPPIPQPLTYEVPDSITQSTDIGYRVEVPLGRRYATGFIVEKLPLSVKDTLPFAVKKIEGLKNSYPFFLPSQMKLFQWVADYYGTDLSTVIDVALPPWVGQKFTRYVSLLKVPEVAPRGKLERKIIELLQQSNQPLDYSNILKQHKGAGSVIKRMQENGTVRIDSQENLDHHRSAEKAPSWAKSDVELNEPQRQATQAICQAISNREFKTFLLHGVTGSGKTEVYIEAIRHAASLGMGALVIVPEIALTPQLIDRFRARLGGDLAILHSALQKRVRWDGWRALLEKRCHIAIGARSGIFAPLSPPGIIIVDEEHDGSYKQAEGLRYNARDLAVVRGNLEQCPVVLGSATPSLETLQNAIGGRYQTLSLPSRPQAMGQINLKLIDLNKTKPWNMPSKNISQELLDAIKDTLERKEQAFILYNRRGFAAYLQCEKCDTVMQCPNCSVTLTYHRSNNSLLCHYCNLSMVPPTFCTKCKTPTGQAAAKNETNQLELHQPKAPESGPASKDKGPGKLAQRGAGTEKVFDEIKQLFPEAHIDRLDRDAASDIDTYRKILDRVRNHQTDILVGTQMIAKGHDLPGVTLVGIIDCDVGLHIPDFRAGERVFQLLTQASGRAGRGDKPGNVILQTRVPKHPSLIFTVERDFKGFALQELQTRQAMRYPPFCRILRVIASAIQPELPLEVLSQCRTQIVEFLQRNNLKAQVLGPSPAPIQKIKTNWRAHLLIKSMSAATLNSVARLLNNERSRSKKYRLVFDMDPQDML